jgi:hypothetical protein
MFKSYLWLMLTLLLATLTLSHPAAFAAEPAIVIDEHFTERSIGLDLSILEDSTAQLTLQDIRSAEYSNQFTPSTKPNPSFGYTQSAYWVRFTLNDIRNPSRPYADLPLMLTLSQAQTNLAELWCANQQGDLVVQQRVGDHVPLVEWPMTFRMPTFIGQ